MSHHNVKPIQCAYGGLYENRIGFTLWWSAYAPVYEHRKFLS